MITASEAVASHASLGMGNLKKNKKKMSATVQASPPHPLLVMFWFFRPLILFYCVTAMDHFNYCLKILKDSDVAVVEFLFKFGKQ